ncbi:glycerophosphoryl diester phosphodiesterase [Staphylococcus virus vB_SurM-PSU5]|nr:glycerophosphoryl diester phosphodiesterase [Staphylococcus virus vB_SurM-PSU5]
MVVRFQSSMGRSLKRVDSDDLNVKGLVLATISKINYQYQSVEVKVNNLTLGRHIGDDGSLSVPYPKSFIGRTPEGSVFGTKPLITEGSVVLIGFLNDDVNSPIILNVYGDNEQNKMINTNPLEGGKFSTDDIYKYSSAIYEILPSLNYKYEDGEGTSIKTYNGKSFFSMTSGEEEKPQASDFYTGTEYQDLFTSYYGNKTLIEPRIQKAPNMLFKHQGVFYDDGTPDNHITTLFLSERGDIRTSVLNTETQQRTTQEMSSDGSYRVIKQDDDLMLDEAQVWIEYGISEDNKFYIKNDKHKFEFTDDGIYIDEKPMMENLGDSIEESMKNLEEVQKELEDINYLLEGIGKDNLEELIASTKESIEASNQATSDVNRLTTQISEVSGRTEGIITQFQKFRDETFKDFYEDSSTVINEVNQNFPSMKTDVNNLKTKVNNIEKTEIPNINTEVKDIKQQLNDINDINDNTEVVEGIFTRNQELTYRNATYLTNEPIYSDGGIEVFSSRQESLKIPSQGLSVDEGTVSIKIQPTTNQNVNILTLEEDSVLYIQLINSKVKASIAGNILQSTSNIPIDEYTTITLKWSKNSKTFMLFINGVNEGLINYETPIGNIKGYILVSNNSDMTVKDIIIRDRPMKNKEIKEVNEIGRYV